MSELVYRASPTLTQFHKSDAFVRLLLGPIGSGKSVGCCIEILRLAKLQPIATDGVRYSRWAVIRNTYAELNDTTIRTLFDWVPQDLGYWNQQQMRFHAKFDPGDGTTVDLEILFRALDRPKDVRKLLSLELTWAWINEAKEVPKAVLDMLIGRVGRYPSRAMVDDYRHGIILDTNPCDVDHWIYRYFEELRPDSWKLFHQPSGLSDEAENRANLPKTYYEKMLPGKTTEWIKVFVHGRYGFVSDGQAMYPEFNDDVHVAKDILEPVTGIPLIVGIDFGLTPAAAIWQEVNGQYRAIDELVTEDMGALNFGHLLGKLMRQHYREYTTQFWGDPAGVQRSQTDEQTPFMMLASQGINAFPAWTNDFSIRRETVAKLLTRLTMTGQPALLISPKCKMLRKAMGGGYKLNRIQVGGEERYHDVPQKNMYSHIAEAAQYALVSVGESDEILGNQDDWGESINKASLYA